MSGALLLAKRIRLPCGIGRETGEKESASEVAVVVYAPAAPVGQVDAQLHKMSARRPTGNIISLSVVFSAQQVHLRSAGSEGVLHHDFGAGAHAAGHFSFPTDQNLELV